MTDQRAAEPTPGPWKVDPDNATQVLAKDFTGIYRRLAKVYGWGRKDSKVNALLIAAAPETAAERDRLAASNERLVTAATALLIERSVNTLEEAAREYPHGKEDVAEVLAVFDNLRAALDEARQS